MGLIAAVVALAAANALLTGGGEYLARILGERVFAELRERLVTAAMHLPLSVVESAGTGDLLGRTGHDLESIRFVVRRGVSQILVIVLTIVSVTAAALLTSPALGACMLVAAVLAVPVGHWYLLHVSASLKPSKRCCNAEQAKKPPSGSFIEDRKSVV